MYLYSISFFELFLSRRRRRRLKINQSKISRQRDMTIHHYYSFHSFALNFIISFYYFFLYVWILKWIPSGHRFVCRKFIIFIPFVKRFWLCFFFFLLVNFLYALYFFWNNKKKCKWTKYWKILKCIRLIISIALSECVIKFS